MWAFLIIIAITLYGIQKYRSLFKRFENVEKMFPGPVTIPVFGNVLSFYGADPHFVYMQSLEYLTKYRRSIRVWMGPILFIILMEPEEVEVLLNNTTHIKKSNIYNPLLPWVGRGLLTSEGQKWKTHRKALTPAFHFKILESFLEIFLNNSQIFCAKLEDKIGVASYNVSQDIKLNALDNICETAMGTSIHAQHNPTSEYVRSIKAMLRITFLKVLQPWYGIDFIFNLTSHATVQKKALAYLHGFTRDVIQQRIKERKENNAEVYANDESDNTDVGIKKKKAFLDILLDAYDEDIMNIDEVQEQVDTFMFEGHDTVTSAISFAFYCLAENQEYQEQLYKELQEIFGDDDRLPTNDDLNKMKYLEMVIKETLRLYPSVPVFARKLEEDLRLDKAAVCPKGAEVLVLTSALHRHPRHWQKPEEFYPDHFLPEEAAKRHPYLYIPFSAGPRNCIGLKFAMLEMKTTLSQVVRKFKILPALPRVHPRILMEVVLQAEGGVAVSIERRTKVGK